MDPTQTGPALTEEISNRQQSAPMRFDIVFAGADNSCGRTHIQAPAQGEMLGSPEFQAQFERLKMTCTTTRYSPNPLATSRWYWVL